MSKRTALLILAWFASWLVLLALGCCSGCSPMLNGHAPPRPWSVKDKPMVFTVRNQDFGYPVTVTVSWWLESTIVGQVTRDIPPGGSQDWTFAALPDGVEVETGIWPPSSGYVWMSPDYRGCEQFIVDYPWASTTRVEPK